MKKSLQTAGWIVVPLLVWLVLVVRATPAQWGIRLADLPVQMEGVTGTVWHGRVANVVVPYPGGSYSLGTLQWDLNPWSLLTLSPCAQFSTELSNQSSSGTVCAGVGGSVVLEDAQVSVPAGVAEIWAPVKVSGQVDAQIATLVFADDQVRELRGTGSWSNARYHNSQTWVPLGTLAFDLSEDGEGGLAARVFDLEGPLEVDLNSSLNPGGAYQIRGTVNLRQGAPQELGQLLAIIARQKQRGQFTVEWVGD